MRRGELGDVVVRARGLVRHLLDEAQLRQLARVSGSGALAAALEDLGYWIAPAASGAALSTSHLVERAIEHETLRRLAILVRWLADRAPLFAPPLELEVRDTLRIRLRELGDYGAPDRVSAVGAPSGWPELRELRRAVARASDSTGLVRALTRLRSPYADPLAVALRRSGEGSTALEAAIDETWARRARDATAGRIGPLRRWVEDEIDLQNAWAALAGGGAFVEGGLALSRQLFTSIADEGDESQRRRLLARAFRETGLGGVFEAPDLGPAALEARARATRIAKARNAARLDPVGEGPIVECVLRLRSERADLRCIGWGIAAGMSVETIVSQLGSHLSSRIDPHPGTDLGPGFGSRRGIAA